MNKKETIQALEDKLGAKAIYLGVPSFAYEIKTGTEIYRIDRYGVVADANGATVNVDELLKQPEPISAAIPELHTDGYAVEFSLTRHTGGSLRNLVNMLSSKQHLLASAFALPQDFMDSHFAEELSRKNTDSIASFQESFQELGPERCPGIAIDEGTVALKLLKADPSTDEMTAFRDLAIAISQNAQALKDASYRPAQEDNPKYAFRTWLIRLGMNGDEFKATRKMLLARLEGNSAFRGPKEKAPEGTSAGEGS